jgi:hypothetical protein
MAQEEVIHPREGNKEGSMAPKKSVAGNYFPGEDAKLQSDIISLRPLYEFINSDSDHKGLKRGSPERRRYGSKAAEVCEGIASQQGFYLWGRYEANGPWRNIYLGKAGFGKTAHLRARILEELKDERACIWQAFVCKETLTEAGKKNHGAMWQKYQFHMARALKKTRPTYIVWVADPDLLDSNVIDIESDLIETLNPEANVSRPVPPVNLQEHTKEIIAEFRSRIHEERSKRFQIADLQAD